jgi:predicted O-linked N-acetylglucosamine transferase (SPINDLY family)
VQVNWLGFPGTLGAGYMDYIIGDAHTIPAGHDAYYSEKVARLPDTYQVNDSKRAISARTPTRAEAGLPATGFVFCCFNNNYKITPDVFGIWMRLLHQVDHSVLWLLEGNTAVSRNLRSEAVARGVSPEQLIFAPRMDLPDHLARHRLADLFLDTLPCNAHTTASDALWAGLPVLTCMGSTFAGRVAGSLLHAVGLPDLVTGNLRDYEALALKLATTPALLSELRTRLADNRTTHPLFDTDRFSRHIESAYVTMMERWARGESPASFTVSPKE